MPAGRKEEFQMRARSDPPGFLHEASFTLRKWIPARWSCHYVDRTSEGFTWPPLLVGVAIGLCLCALVFVRSILANDGFLTPDSTNYLTLAANLRQGHGFQFAGDGRFPAHLHHFAEWPAGYPFLIYLASATTGLSPFISSKLVNMALLLTSATLLAAVFGRKSPVFVLTLAFASYIDIFSYTWSEAPFIFLLLSAAVLLARFIGNSGKGGLMRSLCLAACCLGLFLSRYIGAFAILLIAIAALLSVYRRAYAIAVLNAVLLVTVVVVIWLYLHNNALLTRYATGMPRVPPIDSAAARLAILAGALWSETILPLAEFNPAEWLAWLVALAELLGLVAVVWSVRRHYSQWMQAIRVDALSLSFFTVGALYLGAIIGLRWLNQFDPYNFRLLGPGTLLLVIAVLRVALLSWPAATRSIAAFTFAMAALSAGLAIWQAARLQGPGYFSTVRAVEARYAGVPAGSIVVFGNDNLRYLRTDLFVTLPICPPWYDGKETWDKFIAEVDKRRPIFIDMNKPVLEAGECHPTIHEFLARHRPGELFRLRFS
jgi:hypothetical protein